MLDFASYRKRTGNPVNLRIEINSGEAVVRMNRFDFSVQYDAVGQTVHLAARMEQKMAEAGTALMTASSYRAVEGRVRAHSLGQRMIRGFQAPVEVYELLGLLP